MIKNISFLLIANCLLSISLQAQDAEAKLKELKIELPAVGKPNMAVEIELVVEVE